MGDLADIRGMFVPVPTPFLEDGTLDESLFAEMVDYYITRGAKAVLLLGSYGQGAAMTLKMRKDALEVALRASADRVPVVPNVGTVDPYSAIELGLHARAQGALAICSVGPYYFSDRNPEEILQHMKMIDGAVQLPLFIYNNAKYQGYSITPAMLAKMRDAIPRLFGVKVAAGGISDLLAYEAALGRDFKLFLPMDSLVPGMLMGQAGTVSPPLTLAVDVGVALIAAIDRGDVEEALRLQVECCRFSQTLRTLSKWGRSVYREGLRHGGFSVRQFPRWPTVEMDPAAREELFRAIDTMHAAVGVMSS